MIDDNPPATPSDSGSPADATARSLLEIMSDGMYMLLMVRHGRTPTTRQAFTDAIRQFLADTERAAVREGIANEDIHAAEYAYCAMVDETVLASGCGFRDEWERDPLQLSRFGDHVAGENFFSRLDALRAQGAPRLPSLEVYYLCLLLGFEGKYRIEGTEKLQYLTARLGDEIVFLKGKRAAFAPHWAPPDAVAHTLRRATPLWAAALVLVMAAATGYFALRISLDRYTSARLAGYHQIVDMPANVANITITLP